MSVTTRYRAAVSNAEMQLRAKKFANQASKLADQAGPMTKSIAMTARYRAEGAAERAMPYVTKTRKWMAVQASNGSVAVKDTLGPTVSEMLAATARKLDPPAERVRRLPTALAGMAMLGAGAAAAGAGAVVIRRRKDEVPPIMPPPVGASEETATMASPSVYVDSAGQAQGVDGLPPSS